MYTIYKSTKNSNLEEISNIENDCWVNMLAPTENEITEISNKLNIDPDFLRAALDDEEHSRTEYDEECDATLIVVDSPFANIEGQQPTYSTLPLAIIHTPNAVVTVSLEKNIALENFSMNTVRTFYTYKKSRFILQILYKNAALYLEYLKQIDKQIESIEQELHKSMRNKELIQLLEAGKSLVYFSTSLKSNQIVLKRLTRHNFLSYYSEDIDLLEDTVIETEQAIEMSKIYSDILSSTMDAFASVISNNLNIVMKFLTAITIVMAIPTMISGFFGMNVAGIPLSENSHGFLIIIFASTIVCLICSLYMAKKKMF